MTGLARIEVTHMTGLARIEVTHMTGLARIEVTHMTGLARIEVTHMTGLARIEVTALEILSLSAVVCFVHEEVLCGKSMSVLICTAQGVCVLCIFITVFIAVQQS